MKGKFLLLTVAVLILVILGLRFFSKQSPLSQLPFSPQYESNGDPRLKNVFYDKEGILLSHSWPGDEHFSNEETEIILMNDSSSTIEVKSFDLTYVVEGKAYPHKSGTWEKFPSKQSWDKIEYLNVAAQYYKGEPLILTAGQKGKLHWHIEFGPKPLDGKQTVTVKLLLLKDGQTINIDEQLTRDSGVVFSKEDH